MPVRRRAASVRCVSDARTIAADISYINRMVSSLRDVLITARTLIKARAFTAVCVTSLGLGMGVVIALFLLMRLVLGTPPGVMIDGLVELVIRPSGQLRAQAGADIIDTWSYADYLDVRDAARGMAITGWSRGEGLFRPADRGPAVPLATMYVSSNYFSTIGVALPRGPGLHPRDDASRAEPEAVISHRMWQVRFGSDPNIIGRAITINQTEYVVVGVAPKGFRGHVSGLNEAHYQLWLPLSRHPRLTATDNARLDREASWVRVVARLAPGTTVAQADATVQSAMAALAARYPASNQDKAGGVEPYFPSGARMRSQLQPYSDDDVRTVRDGAARRRPEHLGHDAGPQRDPRAGTGDQAGDGCQPLAPDAVSPHRGAGHGRVRRQLCVGGAVRRAGGRGVVRSTCRGPRSSCSGPMPWLVAAVHRPLLRHEPGAGTAAGASLQPAFDRRRSQERLHRQRPARRPPAAIHRGRASRHRRPVPGHLWPAVRPGAGDRVDRRGVQAARVCMPRG